MKIVDCGECVQCCEWGDDIHIRAPLTRSEIKSKKYEHRFNRIAADPITGDCVYLREGKCSIYEDRPESCRDFDCRELLAEFVERPFGKVIMAAIKKGEDNDG